MPKNEEPTIKVSSKIYNALIGGPKTIPERMVFTKLEKPHIQNALKYFIEVEIVYNDKQIEDEERYGIVHSMAVYPGRFELIDGSEHYEDKLKKKWLGKK